MHAKGRLHKLFCANLKVARKAAGLTQAQVAAKLKISQPSYAQIETGIYQPSLEQIEILAALFGVEAHRLLEPDFAAVAA